MNDLGGYTISVKFQLDLNEKKKKIIPGFLIIKTGNARYPVCRPRDLICLKQG